MDFRIKQYGAKFMEFDTFDAFDAGIEMKQIAF